MLIFQLYFEWTENCTIHHFDLTQSSRVIMEVVMPEIQIKLSETNT